MGVRPRLWCNFPPYLPQLCSAEPPLAVTLHDLHSLSCGGPGSNRGPRLNWAQLSEFSQVHLLCLPFLGEMHPLLPLGEEGTVSLCTMNSRLCASPLLTCLAREEKGEG